MGGRLIPVWVSLANAEQAAVPHIHGDDKLFSVLCGDSALAQYHTVCINVIVNGRKSVLYVQLHSPDKIGGNSLAVQLCKALYDSQVVKIGVHQSAGGIGKFIRGSVWALFKSCFLVVGRDLCAQPPAARVDHQPIAAILALIQFDEVVTAPKRADAGESLFLLDVAGTEQTVQLRLLRKAVELFAHGSSRRDGISNQRI